LGAVSWPADGVSAADISGIGVTDGPGATRQVPIASVAKLMTAYVVLQDPPLPRGGPGPGHHGRAVGGSRIPVAGARRRLAGGRRRREAISERHALEALLLPSADNMAWILTRWDADSQNAFAACMNAVARRLGMIGTSYTDVSGLDSSTTTSTAADQARIEMAAMQVPALAAIVDIPTAVVPVAGAIRNTNTLRGQDGIAGLKTGSTQAAGDAFSSRPGRKLTGATP
jgi:D-alanyl-D-alanine carboxypeptidase (penicillin-binding protein 5/6)